MSGNARKGERLVIGGVPRAKLLPPELEIEKKLRAQRRGLVTILVLVVVLVGVAYAAVTIAAAAAQLVLDRESERTAELLAAQGDYLEVRQLAAQVAAAEAARQIGTSTEIDWQSFMNELHALAPEGVELMTVTMASGSPILPFSETVVPLEKPRIAEVLITGSSPSVSATSDYLSKMEGLPGFADAALELVKYEDAVYKLTIRMHINQDAYTNRFVAEETQG